MVALALVVMAQAPLWRLDGVVDGVKVELRDVPKSAFREIRVSTTAPGELQRICDAIFAKGVGEKREGNFKKRQILKETETERWTYEQISLPVVSDRDYVIHVKLEKPASSGRCEVSFQTDDGEAHPIAPGHVRLASVRGAWVVFPVEDGKLSITYVIHSDPGGSVPAFLVHGGQRTAAIDFFRTILARAR